MKIISYIQDKIFQYKLAHHQRTTTTFPHYENVRGILIIYESDLMEKNPFIRNLRDQLLQNNKDAVLWGYVDKKEVTSAILPQSRILGPNDFNLLGIPKEEILNDLTKRRYDLLIDLTQSYCRPLHYIAMNARADFKAGAHIVDGIHHFMVDVKQPNEVQFLYDQITYYLKNIQSNDKA